MKYVFIEKHQAEFSVKAMCFGLPAVAGMSGVCVVIDQDRVSNFNLSAMKPSVRHSHRQNSVMARTVLQTNCRNTTSKPLPPAFAVRDCGRKRPRKFSPVSYREHGLPVSEDLFKTYWSERMTSDGGELNIPAHLIGVEASKGEF